MSKSSSKPLMRSLGEFVGHIVKAVKTPDRKVLKTTIEEEQRGDITLRRTTIEEVEINSRRK